ncbi:uncharacterized protein LOC120349929 [Nilaparvata lugens]|uniref:uncharacterized protein LOC120349929 n=1 Tax=Nilaparvata lugens TaxID=108931 RepID=UPI00193E4D42|nr:uncharacterized protein LOC120349929 [Nilaparvata lugens]
MKPVRTRKRKHKKRLLVLADSHGRDIGWDLNREFEKDGFEVTVIARSGANFKTVTHDIDNFTKDFNFDDRVVVLAGTNDIVSHTQQPTELDLQPILETARRTKVSIATVPYRYDRPLMNVNVAKLNAWLSERISNIDEIELLELSNFDISDFTRHGLHFNKSRGKIKLRKLIKEHITGTSTSEGSGETAEARDISALSNSDFL